MNASRDFTIDEQAYPQLSDFAKDLHDNGQKYVIILVCSNAYLGALFLLSSCKRHLTEQYLYPSYLLESWHCQQ